MLLLRALCALSLVAAGRGAFDVTLGTSIISHFQLQGENAVLDNLAKLVRLGFHDCVGTPSGNCDGCVDVDPSTNSHNNGLADIYNAVLAAHTSLAPNENRADFFHFSCLMAVAVATTPAGGTLNLQRFLDDFEFQTGRVSVTSCTGTNTASFPDSEGGYSHIQAFFDTQFGLSDQEIVALLGLAHSLGGASVNNSGHVGVWPGNRNTISADYLDGLRRAENDAWVQTQTTGGKWQWGPPPKKRRATKSILVERLLRLLDDPENEKRQGGGGGGGPDMQDRPFNLNVDVCLVRDIGSGEQTNAACKADLSQCPVNTATSGFVAQYTTNRGTLRDHSLAAYKKMIEHGIPTTRRSHEDTQAKKRGLVEVLEGLVNIMGNK